MLYPQSNPLRQRLALPSIWDFRPDPDGVGKDAGWTEGFAGGRPIAVPASWNDLLDDVRNYLEDAWYQTSFDLPWGWDAAHKRVHVRFGSVNYLAEVWLNGVRLGEHEGGHLPFAFDVTEHLKREGNRLVVRVNGALAPDRVPPGNIPADPLDGFGRDQYPVTSFDFFPFCGIHRPVLLYVTSHAAITGLTVVTEINRGDGLVRVELTRAPGDAAIARFALKGHGAEVMAETPITDETVEAVLKVPGVALWSPDAPNLYDLTVALGRNGEAVDRYTLPIGIRTVAVDGDRLLLNGRPVKLRGFGRHEDFPLAGRGYLPVVVVKDYALLRWVGANSFRTSHYPYSEKMMYLADRLGFMVIDETPAVGLFFSGAGLEKRMKVWRQQTRELIARDKNHPAVIMWSLANEPHNRRPEAKACFKEIFDLARALDPTRPLTFASHLGLADQALGLCDAICMNRYMGWYSEVGQLDAGLERLSAELDAIHERYPRPVILSEFGADAIPGMHAHPAEMFTEEYQAEMIAGYVALLNDKPYVVGQHVWNMCDFKTGQSIHRAGAFNFKGVFTRDRRPKLAAHRLRALWAGAGEG